MDTYLIQCNAIQYDSRETNTYYEVVDTAPERDALGFMVISEAVVDKVVLSCVRH